MKYTAVFITLCAIIIIICGAGVWAIMRNQNPQRYYLKGESSFDSGNYENAVDSLTEYISYGFENDNTEKARYYLAAAISKKKEYLVRTGQITSTEAKTLDDLAKRKFIDVINKNAKDNYYVEGVIGYGEVCRRSETYDRFITHKLEDVINSFPESRKEDQIQMLLGYQYLYAGDYRKAMDCFLKSSTELAMLGKAKTHLKMNHHESALKVYEDMFTYFKGSIHMDEVKKSYLKNIIFYGDFQADKDKHTDAIRIYKKVLHHFPQSSEAEQARYNIGESYYALENYDSAKDYYKEAFEDSTHNLDDDSLYRIGLCNYELGKMVESYKNFNNLINQYPRSIYLTRSRQWVRQLKKDLEYFQE